MTVMYYDKDADLELLKGKRIAVIGYGSQGHAQAQNMRDSGLDVVVGELPDSNPWRQAESDGLPVTAAAEACAQAQVIQVLVPDEVQPRVYQESILPHLTTNKALVFSHGFNIHFHQILPPPDVDVYMVAPKGPGHLVRRTFQAGGGVPSLIAVYQDFTGQAKGLALAHAKAIGATRAGVIETTFREETETDLFGEQAVLCGGVTALIKAGFDTLVEAGYQPEIAYFECLHEMKLIIDLIYEGGFSWMRYSISDTAQYGDLTRGPRVIDDCVREEMRRILDEIQSGAFAREWILENQAHRPVFNALNQREKEHLLEEVGQKLRAMMPWLKR